MSATKREFEGGTVRDSDEGKGSMELISPHALFRLAHRLQDGAKHYGERNWEENKGMNWSACYASALRHLTKWWMGMTDEDHLGAAFVNLHFLVHYDTEGKGKDDRPRYTQGFKACSPDGWRCDCVQGSGCDPCPGRDREDGPDAGGQDYTGMAGSCGCD